MQGSGLREGRGRGSGGGALGGRRPLQRGWWRCAGREGKRKPSPESPSGLTAPLAVRPQRLAGLPDLALETMVARGWRQWRESWGAGGLGESRFLGPSAAEPCCEPQRRHPREPQVLISGLEQAGLLPTSCGARDPARAIRRRVLLSART